MKNCRPPAPLHNPGAASGIRAFKELLPDITSVAVFDTAFHTSMPEVAYRYPVPNRYYTDYQVRKYGAHGTRPPICFKKQLWLLVESQLKKLSITAHVGNGVSLLLPLMVVKTSRHVNGAVADITWWKVK